jgi:hypothetical protein
MWDGLADLIATLSDLAEGGATPRFYLSSLDPGVGKTSAIVAFVTSLVCSPTHREVGVLICDSRLDEVENLVEELKGIEVGVFTSDDEINHRQLGSPNSACQVMITTQQMVESRCRNRRFREVPEFYYMGRAREVRIWDEAMLPAAPLTLTTDDLHMLVPEHRALFPEYATAIEDFLEKVRRADDRDTITVPHIPTKYGPSILSETMRHRGTDRMSKSAISLALLAGRLVTVRSDQGNRNAILSYEEVLPPDIAPIVITDASGRVRNTYRHWQRGRGNLTLLRGADKRYDRLTVHVWQRGGGKRSFRDHGLELAMGVAETINTKLDEKWLVVHHKANSRFDLPKEVLTRLEGDADRVHFVSWGNHQATNQYVDVPNVVLAGTLFFPKSLYEAVGRASAGLEDEEVLARSAYDEIVAGENRHLVLQAICRGRVRNTVDGGCPESHAYIIASKQSGIARELHSIFPGCRILTWKPAGAEQLSGKRGDALHYLIGRFDDDPEQVVSFVEVMEAIGMNDHKNFRRCVRRDARFMEALRAAGIGEYSFGPRGFVYSDPDKHAAAADENDGDF